MTAGASRVARTALVAGMALGVLAFGLFGRVTVGVGLYAGSRERVALIIGSADDAMEAFGISSAWRAAAWWGGAVAIGATLALIWLAAGPPDDRD
ncbi:MAG: hypothetical protein ACKOWF_18055 [Chloroflexota bacterium]